MDTLSGYYKQNTHTAATWPDAQFRMENSHTDTNGTVYMVIWLSCCLFGRYGYLDFFTKTISRFFFAQNSFTTWARLSSLQLDWEKNSAELKLQLNLFWLLCLHTLSLSSWTMTKMERCNKMAFAFNMVPQAKLTVQLFSFPKMQQNTDFVHLKHFLEYDPRVLTVQVTIRYWLDFLSTTQLASRFAAH